MNYVVVGYKPWNRRIFDQTISGYPGDWHYISNRDELTLENLKTIAPRYVFFLHWSWKVPEEILHTFECVVFHMTDVPYGRGGSPLQNLIIRGHRSTKLTALRMTEEFDAGPVYDKMDLCLQGNAEEILMRSSEVAAQMIEGIIRNEPTPVPQEGEPTIFKRRKPSDSKIPEGRSVEQIYDHIRMLDAEGYPPAFIELGGMRFEFSKANHYDNRVVAEVTIRPIEENS